MNIFDEKLSESDEPELPISPIELYETCSYADGYGYLRGIQEEVLTVWHSQREQRDVICKMNTGSGKTLTGLLMLYSKLVEIKQPVLFACPDKQLSMQTVQLAKLYGIPVCEFDGSSLPSDFVNSKKILICTFQKLFNGKSVFNKNNIKIGALILDDAHKCVDIARENSSLKLPRDHTISEQLFRLFESALRFQLPGSFNRLEFGDPIMMMKVPYWVWMDNQSKIIEIINSYASTVTEADQDDGIIFKWNFMADNLLTYDCYIGGSNIEINPIHVPYHEIPSFNEADHRYILSATFEDDYDLIKDLGIEYNGIIKPIMPKDRKDIGKRLILAPVRLDPKLSEDILSKFISAYKDNDLNIVVLVASTSKAKKWTDLKAEYVDKNNISTSLKKLKSSTGNFMVFNNRYDGIDLHGDLCRILVIDGLPKYGSLQEQYTESRMESLRAGKKAQIIEQGLGRGVRSGADYCVIYLMGDDLISFLGYEKSLNHFTPVTKAQLNLGLKLLDGKSADNSLGVIKDTASLCLEQNSSWIKYHNQELAKITNEDSDIKKILRLNLAEFERLAIIEFRKRNYSESAQIILSNIVAISELTNKEKGWYSQLAAQFMYLGNKLQSNDLQSKAANISTHMFHPSSGHIYKKILRKDGQSSNVKMQLEKFERPQDIMGYINSIIQELQYIPEISSKDFENKLFELGNFLGFKSQMPEKYLGNGPDVLWCLSDGHYLILEAKSRSIHELITSDNIRQLLDSEIWFKNTYGTSMPYTGVTLQSTNKKGKNVNIHENIKVIDQSSLDLLKENLYQFGTSLQTSHTKSHSEEGILKLLEAYRFTPALFVATYLKDIR